jgi:glycosyltransferase involved in cell wall biosynthesis
MRILQLIPSANPALGGPGEVVRQFGSTLIEAGHKVETASLDDPRATWLEGSGMPVHALGPGILKYCYSSRIVPWLKEHARKFDCVIVNGLWQYVGLATWRASKSLPVPYFVFTHGMLDPWFRRAHPLKHLKKWLYWLPAEYRILRDARAVLFTCEQERLLARQSFEIYRCNEAIVNLGIARPAGDRDQQRRVFLNAFPELVSKRALLFLGRIHPKKGCDLLLTAFAGVAPRDRSLQLVMAGPQERAYTLELQSLAQKLEIPHRITWTGMLSGDLKWGAFHSADAFVLPSHQENFGIAAVEALACGLPVLISDQINIHREIEGDDAGLVSSDTQEGTIALLERWLALPETQRERMRAHARMCFERRFEIRRAAQGLIGVLRANGVTG